jgi:hypothetical protein
MIVMKKEKKRILDNIELALIVVGVFAVLAIVLVPIR